MKADPRIAADIAWRSESGRPAAPLPLVYAEDIEPVLATSDFVEGVLGDGQMSVIYGESNCGKTFFATDLAWSVALGGAWRGRAVDKGPVIIVAAEGTFGIKNRICALRQYHGATGDVPLAVIPSSINLLDPDADTERLIASISTVEARFSKVRVVFVDTLSRALAGGNENSPEDMGALVRNADRIRSATGAHLSFVHHSGKDSARGARGHSLLRAATDTEIEVTRSDGISVAKVTKQREMACEGEFPFRLQVVELGTNTRGKPVTSCVVQPVDEAPATESRPRLSDTEKVFVQELRNALADAGEIRRGDPNIPQQPAVALRLWHERAKAAGATLGATSPNSERAILSRHTKRLKEKGIVGIWGDVVWLSATARNRAQQ